MIKVAQYSYSAPGHSGFCGNLLNNNNMWNLLKTIDKNDIAGLVIVLTAVAICVKIMYIIGNI
jgi:hypothetical protein